jgi:hypothetical protein
MKYVYPTREDLQVMQRWGNVNAKMYPAPTYRHMGVDIGGPVGAPIYAAADGVVAEVNLTGAHGYGRHVIVVHESGAYKTLYAHLHRVMVNVGDAVSGGQQIGEMGGQPGDDDPIDGASTGSHLHFEVILPNQPDGDYVKTWAGYTVDPLPYLTWRAYGEPRQVGRVVARQGVRVRSDASVSAPQIGALGSGDSVPILELIHAGADVWARLWSLRREYAAVLYRGDTLIAVDGPSQSASDNVDVRAVRRQVISEIIAWLQQELES